MFDRVLTVSNQAYTLSAVLNQLVAPDGHGSSTAALNSHCSHWSYMHSISASACATVPDF
jgi:hypothetical protein